MRSRDNKLFVNIKTGVVYHKPVKVNGLNYVPSKDFYEITPEQAERIEKGETLRAVLRDGIRDKVEADLSSALKDEAPPTPADPEAGDEVEAFNTHKEIDAYAAAKGLEIPAACTTMQAKKDFINTALLAQ